MSDNQEFRRRSSILKPRKIRNPLGDVEEHIIDNDKENVTVTPKNRRVSFATNNQVKQFATDDEKNTIWDSTYEETADGSSEVSAPTVNTLQSITTSSKINVIYDENMLTIPVCYIQEQVEKSVINFEENLEFTKPVVDCFIQTQKNPATSPDSINDTLDLTLPVGYNILEAKKVDENKTIMCNEEITTDLTLPINLNVSVNKNANQIETNMSFTQAVNLNNILENHLIQEKKPFEVVTGNEVNKAKNVAQSEINMSFTQVVGDYRNEDIVNLENTLTNKVNKGKSLNQTEINMSFTQVVGDYSNEDIVHLESTLINPLIQEKNSSNFSVMAKKVNKEKSCNQTVNKMIFTQGIGGCGNEDIVNLENKLTNPLMQEKSSMISNFSDIGKKVNKEKSSNQTLNNMSFTQAVGDDDKNNPSLKISLENCLIGEDQSNVNNKNPSIQEITVPHQFESKHFKEEFNKEKSSNQNSTTDMSLTLGTDEINFECSLKNPVIIDDNRFESKSEFSRIAAGDLFPSFSNLKSMPLGEGLNPNEFEVSLSELRSVEHTQEPSLIDLTLENSVSSSNLDINSSGTLEQDVVERKKFQFSFDVQNFPKEIEKIRKKSKKPNFPLFCNSLKRNLELIRNRLNKYNENHKITVTQSVESSIISDSFTDLGLKTESIGTIIKSIENENKRFWKLLSTENDQHFKFSTLYDSINLVVTLKENSDEVIDLSIIDKLKSDVLRDAAYVHKVFIKKLALDRIKAALGSKFDLRSLLDFVREKMLKQREFLREFDRLSVKYKLIMDENYRVIFYACAPKKKIAWKFVIHMSESDFQPDKIVTFSMLLPNVEGDVNINERKIEHIIKMSSSGIMFIQDFIENVFAHIKV